MAKFNVCVLDSSQELLGCIDGVYLCFCAGDSCGQRLYVFRLSVGTYVCTSVPFR